MKGDNVTAVRPIVKEAVTAALIAATIGFGTSVAQAPIAAAGCGDEFQSEWWETHSHEWWDDCQGAPPWGWDPPPEYEWYGAPPWVDSHPINYYGQWVNPIFDPGHHQWGFWLFGLWIPIDVH